MSAVENPIIKISISIVHHKLAYSVAAAENLGQTTYSANSDFSTAKNRLSARRRYCYTCRTIHRHVNSLCKKRPVDQGKPKETAAVDLGKLTLLLCLGLALALGIVASLLRLFMSFVLPLGHILPSFGFLLFDSFQFGILSHRSRDHINERH